MFSQFGKFIAPRASKLSRICSTTSAPILTLAPYCNQNRSKRYEAFDAHLDRDALNEAREWHQSFHESQLPKGNTTYARSSGAGGQHVNKTETKATTIYPVRELLTNLPKAQAHRSRALNQEENKKKLIEEILRIYRANIPAITSDDKKKKHKEAAENFNTRRLQSKKFTSAKKQSRRGPTD